MYRLAGLVLIPFPTGHLYLKKMNVKNLLVPVCMSATHIAYGSIRMEPVFMVLGQSAAVAAALAIDTKKSVQEVDVKKITNASKKTIL